MREHELAFRASTWGELIPGSPFARPCWRWDLAHWIVARRRKVPRKVQDEWVVAACRYMTNPGPARKYTALAEAVHLFQEESAVRRDAVEAYLLTGESVADVAARFSLPEPTVTAYSKLFFDLPTKPQGRDWVASNIIGPGLYAGFRPQDIGQLWKAVGYYLGALALDTVIAVSLADGMVKDTHARVPLKRLALDVRTRRSARLLILSLMIPTSARPMQLAELHTQVWRMRSLLRESSVAGATAFTVDTLLKELVPLTLPEPAPARIAV